MEPGSTKRYFILAAALVAAALGYTWYWHSAADEIRASIPEFKRTATKLGYRVQMADPMVGGFPYRFTVNFPVIDLAHPNGWHLRAKEVTGYAQPWNLSHVIFEFKKPASLNLGSQIQVISPGPAFLSLSTEDQALNRLSLDLPDGTVSFPRHATPWKAGRLQVHVRRASGGAQISLTANNIELPEPVPAMPSQQIKLVQVTGALNGAAQPTLTLDEFEISWPPIGLEGSGDLALDQQRRPTGTIQTFVRGHAALVDLLEATGVLRPRKAALTRSALDMLQSSQNDSQGRLSVKVELQDGRLYLGPVKVMRLPAF